MYRLILGILLKGNNYFSDTGIKILLTSVVHQEDIGPFEGTVLCLDDPSFWQIYQPKVKGKRSISTVQLM